MDLTGSLARPTPLCRDNVDWSPIHGQAEARQKVRYFSRMIENFQEIHNYIQHDGNKLKLLHLLRRSQNRKKYLLS